MAAIRRAVREDAATLAALGARTFTDTFGHLYRPEDLAAFLRDKHSVAYCAQLFDDPDTAVWLAEDAGEAVGFAIAGPCTLPVEEVADAEGRAGELARLYLLKEHQGSGLGGRLLALALAFLEARFERIYVSVYAHNVGAQRLYARHGFVKIRDYFFMVGEHADPEWIMQRLGPGVRQA